MIAIVLVQPENSGNMGAIARAMGNFGFEKLILIDPKAEHLNDEALHRSKHAKDILKSAVKKPKSYFDKSSKDNIFNDYDYVIAFTSVLGTDYNLIRTPLSPEKFSKSIDLKKNYALVFGRDGSGLTNDEIKQCDFPVTIGTSKEYPALNLSHAVSIILYEIYKKHGTNSVCEHIRENDQPTKEVIIDKINAIINQLDFSTPEKSETQKVVWKRVISKANLTKREAYAILGFLSKLEEK